MSTPETETTRDMLAYIAASPTPFHCVEETARRLEAAGFEALSERARWSLASGDARYLVRGGSIIALRVGSAPAHEAGFRLVSAHTDSPNLRIKPTPDVSKDGYRQLGVETYGGTQDWSWLDRDLGVAGQIVLRGEAPDAPLERRLVRVDRPILRVPSLAIHLNREIRDSGLQLNKQKHLPPVLTMAPSGDGEGKDEVGALKRLLGAELGVAPERVLSWELSLFDLVAPCLGGLEEEFVFSARLDNQASCHAALLALLGSDGDHAATRLICLHDHEEIGSATHSGAAGAFVEDVLRRLAETEGPGAEAGSLPRAAQRSFQVSADMAHAVHPNYVDKHESEHRPRMNGGPVIKTNANQRYATNAETAAIFEACCQDADVPVQKFVNRTDLPCGSTIGPISSTRLGIRTVDVGNPMLSMHSIREQCGAKDQPLMVAAMTRFFDAERFFVE